MAHSNISTRYSHGQRKISFKTVSTPAEIRKKCLPDTKQSITHDAAMFGKAFRTTFVLKTQRVQEETRKVKLMLFVLNRSLEAERSQAVTCFGSLRESPIHFYSNGIISHSKIFRRGYLRKITFFSGGKAEDKQRREKRDVWMQEGI